MTKTEVTKILTYLLADSGQELTEPKRDVWFDQFKHVEYPEAHEAARLLLTKKTFGAPRVSDFAEALREIQKAKSKHLEEEQVFGIMLEAVRRFGWAQEGAALEWLRDVSPALAETVQAFGYQNLCLGEVKDHNVLRSQFGKAFTAAQNRRNRGSSAPAISAEVKALTQSLVRSLNHEN